MQADACVIMWRENVQCAAHAAHAGTCERLAHSFYFMPKTAPLSLVKGSCEKGRPARRKEGRRLLSLCVKAVAEKNENNNNGININKHVIIINHVHSLLLLLTLTLTSGVLVLAAFLTLTHPTPHPHMPHLWLTHLTSHLSHLSHRNLSQTWNRPMGTAHTHMATHSPPSFFYLPKIGHSFTAHTHLKSLPTTHAHTHTLSPLRWVGGWGQWVSGWSGGVSGLLSLPSW